MTREEKKIIEEEFMQSWKENFPKDMLTEEQFNKMMELSSLNELRAIKYVSDIFNEKQIGGLKSARMYYDLYVKELGD